MRRIHGLLSCSLVVIVAALVTSAAAAAETGVLPTPGDVSVASGAGKFVSRNGLTVKSTSDEGELKFTNDKHGTFDFLALGFTGVFGIKCTGEKDTSAGSILMEGTFDVVTLTSTETVPHGVVLTPTETHFRLRWRRKCDARAPCRAYQSRRRGRHHDLRPDWWRE